LPLCPDVVIRHAEDEDGAVMVFCTRSRSVMPEVSDARGLPSRTTSVADAYQRRLSISLLTNKLAFWASSVLA
jgi:hypothetical protein